MSDAPTCCEDAISRDDAEKWKQAMDTEINSFENNDTFEVAELPEDKRLVGGKWVYVIKDDGEKCVYKARYVAKGYNQVQGIDYLESFSPTARMESVRMLMQLAVQNNWLLIPPDGC